MDAKELISDARKWLTTRWLEFRERSGFFQARVAVALAYVLIVTATVVIFPIPPPSLDVRVTQVPFGVSERTKVVVKNLRLGKLRSADIVVYGTETGSDGQPEMEKWKTRKDVFFPEDESLSLEGRDFRSDRGRSAPASFTVDKVEVYEDGDLVGSWPRGM